MLSIMHCIYTHYGQHRYHDDSRRSCGGVISPPSLHNPLQEGCGCNSCLEGCTRSGCGLLSTPLPPLLKANLVMSQRLIRVSVAAWESGKAPNYICSEGARQGEVPLSCADGQPDPSQRGLSECDATVSASSSVVDV